MSLSSFSRVFFSLGNLRTCSILKVNYSSDHGTSAGKDPVPEGACGTKKAPLKRAVTPIGKLDELEEGKHPYQEKEPLASWPDGTNPNTGEVGGPKGPEPTRYGDWERKGRVTDF